jgi:receptor expression-enhancing protein 5/6
MDKFELYKNKLDAYLHKENPFAETVAFVESKTGVKRVYLAMGLIGFTVLWLMVGYGAQFLANFIGFIYPAYHSIKAIESPDKSDDTQWLIYWVVYAFFSLLEFFADIFLFWIPLYAFLKCIFLVWCMAPFAWNGSALIYHRLIKPFVLMHQRSVDEALDRVGNFAGDFVESAHGYHALGEKNE